MNRTKRAMSHKMSVRQRSALLLNVLCAIYWRAKEGEFFYIKALEIAISVKSNAKQANKEKYYFEELTVVMLSAEKKFTWQVFFALFSYSLSYKETHLEVNASHVVAIELASVANEKMASQCQGKTWKRVVGSSRCVDKSAAQRNETQTRTFRVLFSLLVFLSSVFIALELFFRGGL
jgi:hypothetical protein